MAFNRIALAALTLVLMAAPAVSLAQNAPYSQVVITTQLAPGTPSASASGLVTITATNPTSYGVQSSNTGMITYATNFSGEIHTINFVPGSYAVSASNASYYLQYSPDCSGFTPLGGATKFCTITLSTTPPPPANPYCTTWYGSAGCLPPVVPYSGPWDTNKLTCTPDFQTIAAGQSATFVATGGTPGGYNWTTSDRTFLNIGAKLSTVFQTSGTQTVIVSNGVQSATCTVNVGASTGPVSYAGAAASVLANYVPALLPNTGFGPQDSASFALVLVVLLSVSIAVYPYVRKALAVALR